MPPDDARIWPYLIACLAVFLIYRRMRRNFGPQRMLPVRMRVRLVFLALLAASMVPLAAQSGTFLAAELAGVVGGAALGVWGAERTRYQLQNDQLYYVPHTYTGIAVSLLFLGRLVYRLVQWYAAAPAQRPVGGPGSALAMRTPVTVALLFLVIGYYACYYGMLLRKRTRISPEDLEASASSAASP